MNKEEFWKLISGRQITDQLVKTVSEEESAEISARNPGRGRPLLAFPDAVEQLQHEQSVSLPGAAPQASEL